MLQRTNPTAATACRSRHIALRQTPEPHLHELKQRLGA
jgi:hypothetical protein